MDIVGYSRLPDDEQARVFRLLQEMVADCPSVIGASRDDRIVRTPTGDGMALSFFGDANAPLRCAEELTQRIAKDSPFEIRMGINSGPVVRQIDINRNTNVSGDGINTAQRVMDFGDAGHVLLSDDFAHALGDGAGDAHDIGTATAKHGKRVRLFNFHNDAIGNAAIPMKVRTDPAWARPKGLRLGLTSRNWFVAALQIVGWILARPDRWREHVSQVEPALPPGFSIVEITRAQLRSNPDLRALVAQVYLLCPCAILAASIAWACGCRVLAPLNLWYSSGAVIGFIAGTLVLGAAPGLALLLFEAVVQPAGNVPALYLALNVIGAIWLLLRMPQLVRESASLQSKTREVFSALGGVIGWLALSAIAMIPVRNFFATAATEKLFDVLTFSLAAFALVNGAFILRWGRWSRGFATGQLVGGSIALGIGVIAGFLPQKISDVAGFAARAADVHWRATQAFPAGIAVNLMDAISLAFAFSLAEKLSNARAAVLSLTSIVALDLLVDPALRAPDALRPWPLVGVAAGYMISRRKR